jgi:glyoxylase-like metal-dependent hydrolase (beta-lactamase superfamily II)
MADQLPPPIIQIVKEDGNVKIHTFISPEMFLSDATHVIEGPNELVVIDGQFVVPYAMQFRGYIDGLGKPINRVYLSHAHVDHFFGLGAAFGDVDIYALPEVIAFLKQNGEGIRQSLAPVYGDFVTKQLALPTHEVKGGTTAVIDSIKYEFVSDVDTEIDYHLSIKLPELGVFIIQDMIYSGGHYYITRDFDNWIAVLQGYVDSEYELFLPGHGAPADKAEIKTGIEYLKTAQRAFKSGLKGEAFKAKLMEAYPNRTGAAVFDIYLPRLFEE